MRLVREQFYLAVTVQNLKRLVRRGGQGIPRSGRTVGTACPESRKQVQRPITEGASDLLKISREIRIGISRQVG